MGWGCEEQGVTDGKEFKLNVWEPADTGARKCKGKRPDVVAWFPRGGSTFDTRTVLDAKYKLGGRVEAADQYQIFAYSLLAKVGDGAESRPNQVALVYPASEARTDSAVPPARFERATDSGLPALKLWIFRVPFPTRDELTPERWHAYLASTGSALHATLVPKPAQCQRETTIGGGF
jgi:hypothetical protein